LVGFDGAFSRKGAEAQEKGKAKEDQPAEFHLRTSSLREPLVSKSLSEAARFSNRQERPNSNKL
jgi:hypothetical protein